MGAGEASMQGSHGVAWRGLESPAEAALEIVWLHARRMEATRRLRRQSRRQLSSPDLKTAAVAVERLWERERGAHK
jgi:hypothetical protein